MENPIALKSKTISGLIWSFADLMASHGIQFIIQIILARLLLPEYFGVIGMIVIFIALSNLIVDSGFTQALIRDQNTTQADYSTVFHFNLFMAITMYVIIFFSANPISLFFGEPQLVKIIRILSLVLVINSLGIIQRVKLVKSIDFKTLAKISFVAVIVSGSVTIILALFGFGIWSLVVNTILMQSLQTLLLWSFNKWIPSMTFNIQSFRKFFKFGYKLLLSGLIDVLYNNLFFVIIGKFYSTVQLGYYTNAVKFSDEASRSISAVVQRVSYPVLSSIQDDKKRLKLAFRKIIKTSAFINFPLMIGLASIAPSLFKILLGEMWMPSVIYFQLLCIAGMLYPLHAINLNILQVKGRSDLFLLLEIIKCSVLTILIISSLILQLGILGLIGASVLNSYIALYINTYFSAREIDYSAKKQIKDLLPVYSISVFMGIVVYLVGEILPDNHLMKLLCQVIVGVVVYIVVCKLVRIRELNTIYQMIQVLLRKYKLVPYKINRLGDNDYINKGNKRTKQRSENGER